MHEDLRLKHSLATSNPKLEKRDGQTLLILGRDVVSFPTDEDAVFYHAAYAAVPMLIDSLELWQKRAEHLKEGRVTQLERIVEERDVAIRRLESKLAETEKLLEQETKARTAAQARGARLARAIVSASKAKQRQVLADEEPDVK